MNARCWIFLISLLELSCRHIATGRDRKQDVTDTQSTTQQALHTPITPLEKALPGQGGDAEIGLSNFLGYCRAPGTPDVQHTISVLLAYVKESDCVRADKALSQLTRLILRGQELTDVRPLAGFTQLQELDLDNNKIEYIAPIASFRNKLSYFSFKQNIAYEIEKNAPVVYLDEHEQYKLSSAMWYLQQVRVADTSGLDLPALGNMPGGKKGKDSWLYIPKDQQYNTVVAGNTSTAHTYVFVKYGVEGLYTDIFYWFFYPFNGPGTAETALVPGHRFETYPIGIHEADWEQIQVRLNPDHAIEKVGLKRHGTTNWYQIEDLLWEETHPIIFPSRNGHAATPSTDGITYHLTSGVEFYDIASYGERFESFRPEHIMLCATSLHPQFIFDPTVAKWHHFFGRWGAPQKGFDVSADAESLVNALLGGDQVSGVLDFPIRVAVRTLFQTLLLDATVRATLDVETGGGPPSPFDGWNSEFPLPEDQK